MPTSAEGDDKPLRVLVVEDDPDIGLLIETQLGPVEQGGRGCEVVRVSSKFTELFTADLSRFDVATVDLMLGVEATGVDILGVLYERWPQIRRVVVTARPLQYENDILAQLGVLAHAVLQKPWDEGLLWQAVTGRG